MGFRFRIGNSTFGRSGVRFSYWLKKAGASVPLFGKHKSTFGVVRYGPLRWWFSRKLCRVKRRTQQQAEYQRSGYAYGCLVLFLIAIVLIVWVILSFTGE